MRIVIQRVKEASVSLDGSVSASIGAGFLILCGIAKDDTEKEVNDMAVKVSKFRIIEDSQGKMNVDIRSAGQEVLSVSQFTLVSTVTEGNRPGFSSAASGEKAENMWRAFNQRLREQGLKVKEGVFGAEMEVRLVNDGPVTFVLDFVNEGGDR